jgi:mannose-6-phosphate isomerase-like protein (cupin superfamily)
MRFETKQIATAPDAIAPDGSEVRVLCRTARGSLAVFTLPRGAVSKAVSHRTVEEIWYVISGSGRLWRRLGEKEEIIKLRPGTSLTITTGTHFQFRSDADDLLTIIGATMPPWPGGGEAFSVAGKW